LKSISCTQIKLHPLLKEVVDLINTKINSLSDLQSLSLDPNLFEIYGNIVDQDLFIINEFYRAKGFRKLHLEVAKLGKSLQILHCIFFPDPCYDLPIFGVDIVISSDNISAAIVDLSPVGSNNLNLLSKHMKFIDIPEFKDSRRLPSWGDIFSPYVCFIRPINKFEENLFLKLIDDYMSILISLLVFAKQDKVDSFNTIDRLNHQKRYCLNQKCNDKTRKILTKFFGSPWTESYIDKILFDC